MESKAEIQPGADPDYHSFFISLDAAKKGETSQESKDIITQISKFCRKKTGQEKLDIMY